MNLLNFFFQIFHLEGIVRISKCSRTILHFLERHFSCGANKNNFFALLLVNIPLAMDKKVSIDSQPIDSFI